MANPISIENLTLNPQEVTDVKAFVKAAILESPEFQKVVTVIDGVTMKQQVVIVNPLQLTGVKAGDNCDRVSSGAVSNLTEKFYEPVEISDLFTICTKEWDGLFKPLFAKAQTLKERYDIQGSDIALMISELVQESIKESAERLLWYGDKNVTAASEDNAGLEDAQNIPAFNPIDGYLTQIYAGVAAGNVKYVDITEKQGSETISAEDAYKAVMDVYKSADARLRTDKDAKFYVSGQVFLGLIEYMAVKSMCCNVEITENGMQSVKIMGHEVIDMTGIFDKYAKYFVDAEGKVLTPHKVLFTTPANLHFATLDAEGINELEIWYNQDERKVKIAFGYTIDAVVVDPELVSIAY